LKTRRVTSISQIGTDRIIEFKFSDGLYRVYLEFYAGGNIVLTDADLNVLALLRNVEEGAEHERLRVGLQYNLTLRQNYGGIPDLTKERVRTGLQKAVDRQQESAANGKKAKKQTKDVLRKALAVSITECSPLLVDHALHVANFDSSLKPEQVLADETMLDKLLEALKEARKISDAITEPDEIKGYILAKPNPVAPKEGEHSEEANFLYDDFHPFRPQQFENSSIKFLEFPNFNKAVDEFFSSIEGQKLESKLHEREMLAKKKLDHARQEQQSRIGGLQQVQELNFRKAEAILANVHRVEEAIAAVNGLISQGMDWGEIARLIEREQGQGNAVAETIKLPLKLYENTITLLLDDSVWEQEDPSDNEGYETSSVSGSDDEDTGPSPLKKAPATTPAAKPKLAIDVDLGLSAWSNSTEYFDQKRSAADKEVRTVQASSKALKSHERKVNEDLKKGLKQEKEILRPVRKQQWFEKFIYFISSDGYLVLGGKDAQQNEIIYKKYFRKGDIYVHADLKGAVPLIIKNNPNTPDAPIPPSTLSQAGHLTVSTSEAWDSKALMSAWWVNSDQVSKIGPTREFLAPGVFNIQGKKEFLPPAQLIVGLAVMFEISEESKARHRKHRVDEPSSSTPTEVGSEHLAEEPKEVDTSKDDDIDSDEDFPDAKIGSDSDEEFPDAKLEEDSEDSDAESNTGKQANPLQSKGAPQGHDSEADSEDEPEKDVYNDATGPKAPTITNDGPQDDAGSIADSEQPPGKGQSRHLSARERRLLRKGQLSSDTITTVSGSLSAGEAGEDDEANSVENQDMKPSAKGPGTVASQVSKAGSNAPLPRGKRGKAKKLAAKYAGQDEEDRVLAMRLLGSQTGQKAAEDEAKAKREKEEAAEANKQRRREQHLRQQAMGKAAEDARRAALEGIAEDEDNDDDGDLKTRLLGLDAFVGRPLPDDEILSAIPICAPWSALASYKYKAKMQPGSLKRGKAVKEVLSKWDHAGKDPKALDKTEKDAERIWPKEIDLIRGWKEAEVVGIMPVSKVRVMMGGGSAGGSGGANKNKSKAPRGNRGSKKSKK
jgi:predicted ribosome quality control (RQC) complex YloA/Tae2 family protein